MSDTPLLDFQSITGDKPVDQARGLRLVLALIEDDVAQLVSVGEEAYRDARGFEFAAWELVVGLAGTLAHDWVLHTDRATAIKSIQAALLANESSG